MIDPRTLHLIAAVQWLTVSAAVLSLAFVVMYARVTFEHTPEGRHKMRLLAFLSGSLGTSVAAQFGLLPVGVLVGVALVFILALNAELVNLIRLFRKAQREAKPSK